MVVSYKPAKAPAAKAPRGKKRPGRYSKARVDSNQKVRPGSPMLP
jgi:hypothetical protein